MSNQQDELFSLKLSRIVDPDHELIKLSNYIHWEEMEKEFATLFKAGRGHPPKPIRLMVGLLMLQNIFNLSDDQVVRRWVENPYWQFFCGYDFLQWEMPCDPTSLIRWRQKLGESGIKKIFSHTVKTAVNSGAVEKKCLEKTIVDTTVMNKNVTFPTDGKLYLKGITRLNSLCKKTDLKFRQSYERVAKIAYTKMCRYAHARQMKRMIREKKRILVFLGRLHRDIERKLVSSPEKEHYFKSEMDLIDRLLKQKKDSKQKIYSLHAPEVECISKGKAHCKYEFGCKVSLVVTHQKGLCLSAEALHGNPYDGHTLKGALKNAKEISETAINQVFVDRGYKGHKIEDVTVYTSGQRKGITESIRKALKRRQAIEPLIGHMKSEGKLSKNYLKGVIGDRLNAMLVGIGYNLRLILRWIYLHLSRFFGF